MKIVGGVSVGTGVVGFSVGGSVIGVVGASVGGRVVGFSVGASVGGSVIGGSVGLSSASHPLFKMHPTNRMDSNYHSLPFST